MIITRVDMRRGRLGIGLAVALSAASMLASLGAADDVAQPQATTAATFVGKWRATANVNGADLPIISICDGRSYSMFVEGQPAPFVTGRFEFGGGRWKTVPVNGPPDEGPFRLIDADTIAMTGKNGKEVTWRRVKGTVPPAMPGGPKQPVNGSLEQSTSQPLAPGLLQDFSALRNQAQAMAVRWKAGSRLFRVDQWGAYSHSRFQPAGARFLFFVPKEDAGLEVRFENNEIRTNGYSLDLAGTLEGLPETVLPPDEALRRLWDLAPTVRYDQVYLQLLRPGVEKPAADARDNDASSYPLQSFLQRFPAPLRENEVHAPQDRPVWRMLAVRDHDVRVDRAYAAFIYVDAVTGNAISAREPAVGVQIYLRHRISPPSPIAAFVFPDGEISLDAPAEQVGTFDALAVGQKAESIDLGLRTLVRDGRSDDEIRAAIDKMCAWVARIGNVRREDTARGIATLEEAARQNPGDVGRQVALFKRYINEIEAEKKRALASPLVVKIEGLNKDSEFWLPKQFEISVEALGTRNQTHMVLDARTGEWLYKMADPPHTQVFSRYFRPAIELLKAIRATGKDDFELERQVTRLNWLIGGNGPALGQGDSLNPIDPLQLMIYGEFNRVRGSETMLSAARLRLPKTWSSTSRRGLGNGTVEVTTTTFTRQPTPGELAAADRLDAIAKGQDAPTVTAVEDLALKLKSLDPRIYYLWSRVEAAFYDSQLADRIAIRGLMIDPACAELHAVRVISWPQNSKVNKAEVYCADTFSRPYTAQSLQGGSQLARLDPLAGYFLTMQRMRIAPDDVGSHAILCDVLSQFDGLQINGQEFMPDAREQRQRELAVGAPMMARLLEHPDEWHKAVPKGMPATRQNLLKNQVNLLTLRGQDLTILDRKDEARACFQKVLSVDPANAAARQALQ